MIDDKDVRALIDWLTQLPERELAGCQIEADDGTLLYTPDGEGNYRALWTRDFAYMVENAWDLLPADDVRACINSSVERSARRWVYPRPGSGGWAGGLFGWTGGLPLGAPPTDNSQFMVNLVHTYVSRTGDVTFARQSASPTQISDGLYSSQ